MISGSFKRFVPGGFVAMAWGSATARLITINCVAFVLVTVANLICSAFGCGQAAATRWLALPGDGALYLSRPWTVFTYMIVNTDLLRLIFNMLWLLCFGRLLSLPMSSSRLIWLYVSGGVAGGVLYLVGSLCGFWSAAWLMGPSASVIAVAVATALMLPQLEINMLVLGRVKVVWVAVCVLLIYFLDIDGQNLGGNAAHVGGALTGIVAGLGHGRVSDMRLRFIKARGNKKNSAGKRESYNVSRDKKEFSAEDNRRLDAILDKVKRAGYGALSDDEKRELFDISGRIK